VTRQKYFTIVSNRETEERKREIEESLKGGGKRLKSTRRVSLNVSLPSYRPSICYKLHFAY